MSTPTKMAVLLLCCAWLQLSWAQPWPMLFGSCQQRAEDGWLNVFDTPVTHILACSVSITNRLQHKHVPYFKRLLTPLFVQTATQTCYRFWAQISSLVCSDCSTNMLHISSANSVTPLFVQTAGHKHDGSTQGCVFTTVKHQCGTRYLV